MNHPVTRRSFLKSGTLASAAAIAFPHVLRAQEGGHFAEWVRACKGGEPAGSNFEHAARITELCLLSNLAVRARRPLDWDAAAMKVTNLAAANQYLTKEYRPGFGV